MKYLIILCVITLTLIPKVAFCIPDPAVRLMDVRAVKLGRWFEQKKCPPINLTLIDSYIESADKYGIDYRLLPAISMQESTCLKHYPPQTNNPYGWASARVGFDSLPAAIDFVTDKLANGHYYAGKTLTKKLNAYNPNPEYAPKIIKFMNDIENY